MTNYFSNADVDAMSTAFMNLSIEDGLKLVERRVLFSEYLTARKKFTKSAEVVGYCMGKLHPHGDSSIYGSLVQLCNCGLSDYNGNFGTDIGLHEEPPAAMRYTEVKMNEDVVNMAFKHLDFVPFESLELPMKEPVYLATKLPLHVALSIILPCLFSQPLNSYPSLTGLGKSAPFL